MDRDWTRYCHSHVCPFPFHQARAAGRVAVFSREHEIMRGKGFRVRAWRWPGLVGMGYVLGFGWNLQSVKKKI